ncbi:MAG: N-acetylglucosamine kinase, partial [Clostridiales bacterium]|nr:N-acetylglucosamine kinase [Clostridiales bacterium]
MQKYLLGVDGGNTKTHYFLYTEDGIFADYTQAGPCSHETMPDGFLGTEREMRKQLDKLFFRNGMHAEDVGFGVFGLAGADFESQKSELKKILRGMGFSRFVVDNDGYLALKAGTSDGTGVCCINGTGTVTVGI